MSNNILLSQYETPFNAIPFSKIKNTDFLPAIKEAINMGLQEIKKIEENQEAPNFENTIEALEFSGRKVGEISSIFFNLNSAETNDEIQSIARDLSPLLTNYKNDVLLNAPLFERVKSVYENQDRTALTPEQNMLLEKSYKSFVRNGALLNTDQKELLRVIDADLAEASLKFGENVLEETNVFMLQIESEEDLEGLPEGIKEAAKMTAQQEGLEGWVFTLQFPSYVPFMMYAKQRHLRKMMFEAYASRAFRDNEHNNEANIKSIVELRQKRASLLGYATHADFVLEERMANSVAIVNNFLDELLDAALPKAKEEYEEMATLAQQLDGIELQRWDWAYYAEIMKSKKLGFDEEQLKPYFELESSLKGMFETVNKLYGITLKEIENIDTYHEEVRTFEVIDTDGIHLAIFYVDFHPRPGKRPGAWMTSYQDQYVQQGHEYRPHISIVCNFSRSTESAPALLSFNELTTLFHEFGHALHGILAQGKYPSLSGTSVSWDFVELPSQIMENWCYQPECLNLFAKHYETGELIPEEWLKKIKENKTFLQGYQTVRQLSFGKLDMSWHGEQRESVSDVSEIEINAMAETELFHAVPGTNMSCSFSHIFQGGYSAGYYSYKWAEVLDADAFESFEKNGIFDAATATSFRKNILEKGGAEHPMELYKKFKGSEPSVAPLLKRSGLI